MVVRRRWPGEFIISIYFTTFSFPTNGPSDRAEISRSPRPGSWPRIETFGTRSTAARRQTAPLSTAFRQRPMFRPMLADSVAYTSDRTGTEPKSISFSQSFPMHRFFHLQRPPPGLASFFSRTPRNAAIPAPGAIARLLPCALLRHQACDSRIIVEILQSTCVAGYTPRWMEKRKIICPHLFLLWRWRLTPPWSLYLSNPT